MKITKPLIEVAKKYNDILSNCTFYQLKMTSEINLIRNRIEIVKVVYHFTCIYFIISMMSRCEAIQGVSDTIRSILCFYSEYASDCYIGNPFLPHLTIIACMFLKILMFYFN